MVDLRPDQLATVLAILQAKVPECEVWAFGSRAKWTAKDSSDLDLALVTSERIPLSLLGRLRQAFADSYLPMTVDVVDLHRVSDEFREIIERQKVVLQKPSAAAAGQTDRAKWQTLPLEQCLETLIDYRGKTPKKVSSGIPLITARVVKNGRIETPDEFIAEEDYEGWMRRGFPQAGDVLLTMEAPLGEVAQLDDRKVALAQRLVALRGKQGLLDNWYLKYLLQSDLVQDQLRARATGTTVLGIKQSELRKINLTLPPLDEQRAMAQVLGTLDDKIELNRRMNETLETMAQNLFKSWFVDATQSALPKGWREYTLGDVIEVKHGFAYQGEFFRDEPRRDILLTPGNFAIGGGFKEDKFKYYEGPTPDEYVLSEGDLLVTMTDLSKAGDTLGYGALLPAAPDGHRFHHNQRLGKVLIQDSGVINKPFLYQVLRSHEYRAEILGGATGTTVKHTSPGRIKSFKFVLPPEPLMQKFGNVAGAWHELAAHNRKESRTLVALRDALLPKLLSGEVRAAKVAA